MAQDRWDHVYFFEAEGLGLIKIGRALNVIARLKELQTGCPVELSLAAAWAVRDGSDMESRLHRRYKAYRVRGEWFRLPEDVLAHCRSLHNHIVDPDPQRRPVQLPTVTVWRLPDENTDSLLDRVYAAVRSSGLVFG